MDRDPRFLVDPAKCVTCGACVRDCAFKALKSDAEKRPVMAHPARCMLCQHCLSISRGVIDSRDLLYFVFGSALFLFLTKITITKK